MGKLTALYMFLDTSSRPDEHRLTRQPEWEHTGGLRRQCQRGGDW
jgi:hypothetical protein